MFIGEMLSRISRRGFTGKDSSLSASSCELHDSIFGSLFIVSALFVCCYYHLSHSKVSGYLFVYLLINMLVCFRNFSC